MSSTNPMGPARGALKSLDITFVAANAYGIALYLWLASRGWFRPEEPGISFTGEPFVWALALPVLGVFFVADIGWGGVLLRGREPKRWLWWLVTALAWLLAIGIDFSHH